MFSKSHVFFTTWWELEKSGLFEEITCPQKHVLEIVKKLLSRIDPFWYSCSAEEVDESYKNLPELVWGGGTF